MKEDEINAVDGREELLRGLARKLRRRNVEQTWAFKDVFAANQGLLNLNEKLRQQTLDQDKACVTSKLVFNLNYVAITPRLGFCLRFERHTRLIICNILGAISGLFRTCLMGRLN